VRRDVGPVAAHTAASAGTRSERRRWFLPVIESPRFSVDDRGRAHGMVRVSRVHGDPRRILLVEPGKPWRSTGHRAGLVGVAVK
jgi:hypothetical protein